MINFNEYMLIVKVQLFLFLAGQTKSCGSKEPGKTSSEPGYLLVNKAKVLLTACCIAMRC